jgi:hypothetical protein
MRVTLDRWAQDPAFVSAQRRTRLRFPEAWTTVEFELRNAARELGEFSAEDVMERVGRAAVPPNLIGAVLGSWRSRGYLRVSGRERARHAAARGRWLNRFVMVQGRDP